MREKAEIMDEKAMNRAIARITYEILERNKGTDALCLVGIYTRGVEIANRIARKIAEVEQAQVPVGCLDITPFRDDGKKGDGQQTQINFPVEGKNVVVVDDVFFTGRSARAALDAIISRGRPKSVQLAVLVDRGHRELPLRADYVGKNLPTSRGELVQVYLQETDGQNRVTICEEAKRCV